MPRPSREEGAARPCPGKSQEQRVLGCFGTQLRHRAGHLQAVLLICLSFVLGLVYSPPADAVVVQRPYEVVMVLHGPEGAVERAFKEYFAKRSVPLHVRVVTYSGRAKDQPALAAQLRRLAPDLVYTADTVTTLAVAGPMNAEPGHYITDIPVVFTSVSDPISAGLVADLKRPGRKLTGVVPLAPMSAQVNAIAAYRRFGTLGYLYKDSGQTLATIDRLRALGQRQGFKLVAAPVPLDREGAIDVAAIPGLVRDLKRRGVDFLYVGPETFVTAPLQKAVAQAALEAGLPTYSALESAVRDNGALFGVFSPATNVGRFAALKAMRILSHAVTPDAEPIESLERFSIVINMSTAQRLQLYPPMLLLDAADVVGGGG